MLAFRELGNTGLKVSDIGFGAWQLGNAKDWGDMSDNKAIQLVHKALDSGCNFFDTAPGYGEGRSESLLGQALVGKRDQVVINTKFGHGPSGTDYRAEALRPSIEGSLSRLKTDYIDTVLLHNPPFEYLNGAHPIYEELEKLKVEGKIRAYGASVDSAREMKEVIETTKAQVFEVLFNIFHQETASQFATAKERGMGIIVKVPLDSGWLSGKYNQQTTFTGIRSRWTQEDINRRFNLLKKLKFLTDGDLNMIQAALRFILSYDEVSTIIPGVRNEEQLLENMKASGHRLGADLAARLEAFWKEEIADQPLPW